MSIVSVSNKDLNEDIFLGYLVFCGIGTDVKIKEEDLKQLFIDNMLNEKFVRPIRTVDAFRRASSHIKGKIEVYFNGETRNGIIDVDEVTNDKNFIVRLISRKVVDSKNQDLNHEIVGKLVYDKENKSVSYSSYYSPFMNNEYEYELLFNSVINLYNDYSAFHNKDTIRNMYNYIINTFQPITLNQVGTCKFIPKYYKGDLYKLGNVIESLPSNNNSFEIIPLIDTQEHRDKIEAIAAKDMQDMIVTMETEMAEIIKTKESMSTSKVSYYITKFKELKTKSNEYQNLLNIHFTTLERQIKHSLNNLEINQEI